MRLGTPAFRQARKDGEPVYVRIDVLLDGEQVASTEDTNVGNRIKLVNEPTLSVKGGSAVVTAINTLELVIPDSMVTKDAFGIFSPMNGAEFQISTGYLIDGKPETQSAALVRLEEVRFEDHGDGRRVYCDLFDRAKQLERSIFVRPHRVAAGANINELIGEYVADVYPDLQLVAPTLEAGASAMEISDTENRLSVITKLAAAVGHSFYFDAAGIPTLRPPPLPDTEPVLTFSQSANIDGELLSICRTLKREGVYNGVITKATSTRQSNDTDGGTPDPIFAQAWADNILTPMTYTQAMYEAGAPGAFPLIRTSQILKDQSQVNISTVAAAELLALQPEHLSMTVRPQPGLELYDVVAVDNPTIGAHGLFTVGAMQRPLGPSAKWLGIGCNERRTA